MTFIPHVIDGQESESASGARFAGLIEANADVLALADTTDMGKPISDARGRTVLI